MPANNMNALELKLSQLGITQEHRSACRMPEECEAVELVDAGLDMFDRPIQMTKSTFLAWSSMFKAAQRDGIELQVVSAFRSIDYQCGLIERKLQAGQALDEILKVNAIPGHSQHHTGRALDLSTPEFEPLDETFESSNAFEWLMTHAGVYQFKLSYPRGNAEGIVYEPWHWAHQD